MPFNWKYKWILHFCLTPLSLLQSIIWNCIVFEEYMTYTNTILYKQTLVNQCFVLFQPRAPARRKDPTADEASAPPLFCTYALVGPKTWPPAPTETRNTAPLESVYAQVKKSTPGPWKMIRSRFPHTALVGIKMYGNWAMDFIFTLLSFGVNILNHVLCLHSEVL